MAFVALKNLSLDATVLYRCYYINVYGQLLRLLTTATTLFV